jgi:hypothetical protein
LRGDGGQFVGLNHQKFLKRRNPGASRSDRDRISLFAQDLRANAFLRLSRGRAGFYFSGTCSKGYNAEELGRGEATTMKTTFTVAAVILPLLAAPAFAQGAKGGGGGAPPKDPNEAIKKIDEKAYKNALERIPEPKEKYDPWGVARPAEPANKPK